MLFLTLRQQRPSGGFFYFSTFRLQTCFGLNLFWARRSWTRFLWTRLLPHLLCNRAEAHSSRAPDHLFKQTRAGMVNLRRTLCCHSSNERNIVLNRGPQCESTISYFVAATILVLADTSPGRGCVRWSASVGVQVCRVCTCYSGQFSLRLLLAGKSGF